MVGGHDSNALGWNRGSQVRAWTSRSQVFRTSENFSAALWPGWSLLDASGKDELRALRKETDPALFFEGIFCLARRQVEQGRLPAAFALLSRFAEIAPPEFASLREHALRQMETWQGRGPVRDRLEGTLARLPQETLHPAGLAGFFVGATAFRLARFAALSRLSQLPAASPWAGSLAKRGLASLAGMSAEIPALVFTQRAALAWSGEALEGRALGPNFLSAALLIGPLRLAGAATKHSPWGALAGINLGHALQIQAGLRPKQDGWSLFADSLTAYLQLEIAGRFSQGLLGPDFARLNRFLDLRADRLLQAPRFPGFDWGIGGRAQPALAGPAALPDFVVRPLRPEWRPSREDHILRMDAPEGASSWEPWQRELKTRYENRFPKQNDSNYSQEILATVLRIRPDLPAFHERLLEALARCRDAGSRAQFHRVLALEDIFQTRALATPTGSWDYALLELFAGQALREENVPRRQRMMQDLFQAMDGGVTRADLRRLLQIHGLGKDLRAFPTPENQPFEDFYLRNWPQANRIWGPAGQGGFPGVYRPMLLHFVFHYSQKHGVMPFVIMRILDAARRNGDYEPALIDSVLQAAQEHPQGLLMLERLFQVMAVGDLPAKLREMAEAPFEPEVTTLPAVGSELERERAREAKGGPQTAYFDDEATALRLLRILDEIARRQTMSLSLTQQSREKFLAAYRSWADSGRPLSADDLIAMLEGAPNPDTRLLSQAWAERRFSIEVLSDEAYDGWIKKTNLRSSSPVTVFIYAKKPGEPDRILVRRPPTVDLETGAGQDELYFEILNRLDGLAHEWDHLRRFRSSVESESREAIPIRILNITREDRLRSEVLAYMAEVRWRNGHQASPFVETARLLNLPLPLYLRNVADASYFREENEEKLRALKSRVPH